MAHCIRNIFGHSRPCNFARLVGLLGALILFGCRATQPHAPRDYLQASAADMEWFKAAKFGMFVHWGPVSIQGTEIGWSRDAQRPGRSGRGQVPVEIYDNLYKQFNPTEFNADEWIATAKAAGMKYFVFTTKHHDGFNMFNTKLSEYKITNSPFKRDVCKELADACHKAGMKLGWYYSQPDWHHPDYRTENHRRYIEYMHGQLRELCTNYGKVDIIWFDGLGGTAEDWDSENLFKMIRTLQPGIVINNRAGLPADWDTPEQEIGSSKEGRPWETCMTIGDQWSYKPNDRTKSFEECILALVLTNGGGGNLLFNVGPRPDGRIEPVQVERLKEMGRWLARNGYATFNTKGGPFPRDYWGTSTCRGSKVFLHILGWEGERNVLPPIEAKVLSARLPDGSAVAFEQTDRAITLRVPMNKRDPIDTIITLKLDRPADRLKIALPPSGSVATGKKAEQPGISKQDLRKAAKDAFDDNYITFWSANISKTPAYLEVDLGAATQIDRVRLCEILKRTEEFVIEGRLTDTGEWSRLTGGTTIGQTLTLRFPPTEVRYVRLGILRIEGHRGPQIAEFQIFSPSK